MYPIKNIARKILNYFFRGNNLLKAQIKAQCRNNVIKIGGSSNLKNVKIIMMGGGNFVQIGERCTLSGVVIYMNSDNNRLVIGDNVRVNATISSPSCFNACDGCTIEIEANCLFSNNIEIHTTDYHKLYAKQYCCNKPQNVHIGEHTWIGLRSLILKGVRLAPNTVVGANSVVTHSCEESNVVIAGVPAEIVKNTIDWDY